jgi:hypothetical protein
LHAAAVGRHALVTDADPDTVGDRSQETDPEHLDVLAPGRHDEDTAAEAAEQADPGVTGADQGA